jgi:L-ascorbate metabolism protein UlaG (beta-lactamase superfamily)
VTIILSPIASTYTTSVSVDGLVLTIDGVAVDLSLIPEGGYAIPEEDGPFVGKVTRERVVIKYHYDLALAEPAQSEDWDDYTFDVVEGVVPSPIVWRAEAEEVDSVSNN